MSFVAGVPHLGPRQEEYRVIEGDIEEEADVCIVGSGAAGAVIGKKLSDKGLSVVLLERGGYHEGEDMNERDEDMFPLLWKNSGAQFTDDMVVAIGQGSCLGGSTVINSAVCLPIPPVVRRQWRELGVDVTDKEWDRATEEVSKAIHVTQVAEDELNRNNLMLRRGCELLGFTKHSRNSRNCLSCMRCGLCHLGCHYETKQDMRVTYIRSALRREGSKVRIYCDCRLNRLDWADGMVRAADGEFTDAAGKRLHAMRVRAGKFVLCAGAIASSQLLMKNAIAVGRAGVGLALHPVASVLGDFPFEIRANQGIPMAYTLHEFGVTNGVEQGGFLIEAIFLPPFQYFLQVSTAGDMAGEMLRRYNNVAMAFAFPRDKPAGRISLTEEGECRISYTLDGRSVEDVATGVGLIARMWFRLGATRVLTPHKDMPVIHGEEEVDGLVGAIKEAPKRMVMVSAHPQGGNKMGKDANSCVVDSNCRVHGFKNLFVCDASVFPTAVGVNPQVTVMALATIMAERISRIP